ncbi:response regulator [Pseudomonadota bacterium]
MRADDSSLIILMADDDEDDCLLAKKALEQSDLTAQLRFVKDGEELMAYLNKQGSCEHNDNFPKPDIILLDLNMPKMNGLEALKAIKSHSALCSIPVIILTTSRADHDICNSYAFGASSFITKPASFKGLVETMDIIKKYWFEVVELPKKHAV